MALTCICCCASGLQWARLATISQYNSGPPLPTQVPKSALSALPFKELEFFDTIKYDPLQHPPYRLHVHSEIPALNNKVSEAAKCVDTCD